MQKSGFFDTTLDDPREYPAREFAEYFSRFIGNGIFGGGTTLKVEPGGGHTVSINIGYAWINGYMYSVFGEPIILNLQESDGANRIDRIVLRLDTSIRKRCITVEAKQGNSATVPPALERAGEIYELSLARVFVQNGKTIIDGSQITDERLENELCGIVTGVIEQADTTAIFNQFQAWYSTRTLQYQQEWDDWLSSATTLFGEEWTTWFNGTKQQWQDWFDSVSKDAPVVSVNGKAGVVVLSAEDVGAPSTSEFNDLKSSVSDGKATVAAAITGKGVPTAADAPFQTMADNIDDIVTDPSGDATATAADLLAGKTAYSQYQKVVGTMPNRTGHITGQSISRSGTTLRIRPQQGHYPADTANSVQWSDPNWVAENIPEDLSMFGLQGVMVRGKKFATGTALTTRSSGYIRISVRGLTFKPTLIVANINDYRADFPGARDLTSVIHKPSDFVGDNYVNIVPSYQSALNYLTFNRETIQGAEGHAFQVLSDGFDMQVFYIQGSTDAHAGKNIPWIAIE